MFSLCQEGTHVVFLILYKPTFNLITNVLVLSHLCPNLLFLLSISDTSICAEGFHVIPTWNSTEGHSAKQRGAQRKAFQVNWAIICSIHPDIPSQGEYYRICSQFLESNKQISHFK